MNSEVSAKIGDTVAVKFPSERIFSSRGYYVAIGNEGTPSNNQQIVFILFIFSHKDCFVNAAECDSELVLLIENTKKRLELRKD